MKMILPQHRAWHPDRPTSKGATAFHEAVVNSTWIKDILYELVNIAHSKINDGAIVVDFGAGTGTSAILLLQHVKKNIKLWLVDNSPSWLGKAYDLLNNPPKVECFLLEKRGDRYATLSETIGEGIVDHVISANTVHLIPNIEDTFRGINSALKNGGFFTFQTGNFLREDRPEGALMIDDTIKFVHDIALEIVRANPKYSAYLKGLDERVKAEEAQRRFVFPDPRPIELYLEALENTGFECKSVQYIPVKIKYSDWLNFLRVKRLQAGILPEIGGKEPNPEEEQHRDELITIGALKLFKDLEMNNPLANKEYFTIDCVYITTEKVREA